MEGEYPGGMARAKDLRDSPSVVLIGDPPSGDMDTWFAGLVRDKPTELSVTAADLVAEARSESG